MQDDEIGKNILFWGEKRGNFDEIQKSLKDFENEIKVSQKEDWKENCPRASKMLRYGSYSNTWPKAEQFLDGCMQPI